MRPGRSGRLNAGRRYQISTDQTAATHPGEPIPAQRHHQIPKPGSAYSPVALRNRVIVEYRPVTPSFAQMVDALLFTVFIASESPEAA